MESPVGKASDNPVVRRLRRRGEASSKQDRSLHEIIERLFDEDMLRAAHDGRLPYWDFRQALKDAGVEADVDRCQAILNERVDIDEDVEPAETFEMYTVRGKEEFLLRRYLRGEDVAPPRVPETVDEAVWEGQRHIEDDRWPAVYRAVRGPTTKNPSITEAASTQVEWLDQYDIQPDNGFSGGTRASRMGVKDLGNVAENAVVFTLEVYRRLDPGLSQAPHHRDKVSTPIRHVSDASASTSINGDQEKDVADIRLTSDEDGGPTSDLLEVKVRKFSDAEDAEEIIATYGDDNHWDDASELKQRTLALFGSKGDLSGVKHVFEEEDWGYLGYDSLHDLHGTAWDVLLHEEPSFEEDAPLPIRDVNTVKDIPRMISDHAQHLYAPPHRLLRSYLNTFYERNTAFLNDQLGQTEHREGDLLREPVGEQHIPRWQIKNVDLAEHGPSENTLYMGFTTAQLDDSVEDLNPHTAIIGSAAVGRVHNGAMHIQSYVARDPLEEKNLLQMVNDEMRESTDVYTYRSEAGNPNRFVKRRLLANHERPAQTPIKNLANSETLNTYLEPPTRGMLRQYLRIGSGVETPRKDVSQTWRGLVKGINQVEKSEKLREHAQTRCLLSAVAHGPNWPGPDIQSENQYQPEDPGIRGSGEDEQEITAPF